MTTNDGGQDTRNILIGAILALILLSIGLTLGYFVFARPEQPQVVILPTRINPTIPPLPTLTPTGTVAEGETPPTATAPEQLVLPSAPPADTATPMPTLLPDEVVRFRAQVDNIPVYAGPSNQVGQVGGILINQEVLVAGRSTDGVWWLVCCVADRPGWVQLANGNLILISGDIATVDVIQ